MMQPATKTFKDNHCMIKWVLNLCTHPKVKHIDVPLKALCKDVTEFKNLNIEYIDMMHQMADVMTMQELVPQGSLAAGGAHAQCADSRWCQI